MKKAYTHPELDISVIRVTEAFSASSIVPDVEYDDIEGWSPIIPPSP